MIKRCMWIVPALLLPVFSAQANIYDFSYVGINDPAVYGSGTFTTGTAYGNGYLPVTAITGFTEAGQISGLEVSGGAATEPGGTLGCCNVGPGGAYYLYDNAFSPSSVNPFSSTGGVLFHVAEPIASVTGSPVNPIELFGDGAGNTYEFSYGEDVFTNSAPSFGGTQVAFTSWTPGDAPIGFHNIAIAATPEPGLYGVLAVGLSGLVLTLKRRRRAASKSASI